MTKKRVLASTPKVRPFSELMDSGLLWLINRVVFHPRGFALGINDEGWTLQGDGASPWSFTDDMDQEKFTKVKTTLERAAIEMREILK